MKIYISHSSHYDFESELYEVIRRSDVSGKHRFFLPHEPANADIPAKEELARTDLLIAEVSHPSTGQGIEIGLASAAGVPIVCLYRAGAEPSGSLRFVSKQILQYRDTDDFLAMIADVLTMADRRLRRS